MGDRGKGAEGGTEKGGGRGLNHGFIAAAVPWHGHGCVCKRHVPMVVLGRLGCVKSCCFACLF